MTDSTRSRNKKLAGENRIQYRDQFAPEINVAFEMTLQILHALFGYQVFGHMVPRRILASG